MTLTKLLCIKNLPTSKSFSIILFKLHVISPTKFWASVKRRRRELAVVACA
jgi:hypothetical protein